MPRKSAEERAASLFRMRTKQLQPPPNLSPPARKLWRQITGGMAADRFDAWAKIALATHCETIAQLDRLAAALSKVADPASPEATAISRNLKVVAAAVGQQARQLRLSTSSRLDQHSGQLTERGITNGASNRRLLGGHATR
jgi:hypothetical protein